MKKIYKNYSSLFLFSGLIIGLDQLTKALVRKYIPLGGSWMPIEWLQPYARVVHWYNTGAAFGLFQNGSLIFGTLAIIVIILIIYYYPQVPKNDWTFRSALVLQLAGAAGNLIDRIVFGGRVTDFISLGKFAVFNIADSSISIGVAVLLIGTWVKDREQKKRKVDPPLEINEIVSTNDGSKNE